MKLKIIVSVSVQFFPVFIHLMGVDEDQQPAFF